MSVSFVKGCAVQSMIDSDHFDIAGYLAAAERLIRGIRRRVRPRLAAPARPRAAHAARRSHATDDA